MIQYRFRVGNQSDRAWLENDNQAAKFANLIGAAWCRDTAVFRLRDNDKFCTFELDLEDVKDSSLNFKNVKIWEIYDETNP